MNWLKLSVRCILILMMTTEEFGKCWFGEVHNKTRCRWGIFIMKCGHVKREWHFQHHTGSQEQEGRDFCSLVEFDQWQVHGKALKIELIWGECSSFDCLLKMLQVESDPPQAWLMILSLPINSIYWRFIQLNYWLSPARRSLCFRII